MISNSLRAVFMRAMTVLMMALVAGHAGAQAPFHLRNDVQRTRTSVERKYVKRPASTRQTVADATCLPLRRSASPHNAAVSPVPEKLYGALIANDSWSYSDKKYGLYELNPSTGEYTALSMIPEIADGNGGAVYVNGKFYVSLLNEFYGYIYDLKLVELDTESGEKQVYDLDKDHANAAVNMTYDAVNDVVYSINYHTSGSGYTLSTFNPSTRTYTVVCDLADSYRAMCADGSGHLYVIDDYGDVRLLDKTTGEVGDPIVSTGFSPQYSQSCCWSPSDNKIYWAACNYYSSELIAIDPVAGTQSTVTTFSNSEEWIGLYSTDPFVEKSAPASATGMVVKYATPGSLASELSCVLPTKTVGGDDLTGTLTVTVSVDGVTRTTESGLQPGAVYRSVVGMETGAHTVSVTCANDKGNGLSATVKTYAGEDAPLSISDLKADIAADGTVTLSWKEPAGGKNGGWTDPAKITYTVTRNGETVAENIRSTAFTETLPADVLTAYTYSVTVNYGGEAVATETAPALTFGQYVTLPYVQPFDDAQSFSLLTVIDNNHDGVEWKFDTNQSAVYTYSSDNAADDYLVFPKMRLRANHVYRIRFDALAGSSSFPERLSIVFGSDTTAASLTTVVMDPVEISENNDPRKIEATYIPETDTDGHFAVYCTSNKDQFSVNVDNVVIEEVGTTGSPKAPEHLTAVADKDGRQAAAVSLTAPTLNYLGNQLVRALRVELHRNGKLIHTFTEVTPGAQLSYADEEADFGFNTYTAVAYDGEDAGASAETTVFLGIYTLPYEVAPSAREYSLFTVIDNNVDDNTWFYDQSDNSLKYAYSSKNAADDYVITPPVELGTANLVDVEFDLKGSAYSTERVAVTFGKSPTADGQQEAQRIESKDRDYTHYKASFEVTEPGRYYIGFRALSDANQFTINIRNIRISNGSLMKAPAAVTGLTATPAEGGTLRSVITFTAPTLSLDGNELTGTVTATVRRADGTVVETLSGLQPGAEASCTDDSAVQGDNAYTVVAANEFGNGSEAQTSCFCGIDVPGEVRSLKALPSADNLSVSLTWDAPASGAHDGYFSSADITYNIYEYANSRLTKIGSSSDPHYLARPSSKALDNYYFIVSAQTVAGEGPQQGVITVLGTPLSLPYEDNLYNSVPATSPWVTGTLSGSAKWGLTSYIRSLNLTPSDGGMLVCYDENGASGVGRMQMPKVCLGGYAAPTLTFQMYRYQGAASSLSVKVTSDEVNYKEVYAQTVAADEDGWQEVKVNLAEYKDKPWVAIVFDGTVTQFEEYVIADNFRIENESEYDARITALTGARTPVAGQTNNYKVSVQNHGKQPLTYSVEFGVNGQTVQTARQETAVEAGGVKSYTFGFEPLAEMIGQTAEISVRVVPDGWTDEVAQDNYFAAQVTVAQPQLAPVTDLAVADADGGKQLQWTEPKVEMRPVTDDFEGYESFEYQQIGDYTLYDGDELTPCGILGVKYPGMGEPMAWQVWEPKMPGVDVDASIWEPHSGNKCLVAWTSLSQYVQPFNDDWLISPEVEGGTGLSFFATMPVSAYSPETFEVLWSDGSTDPADFQRLASEALVYPSWREFSYTLPAEARRFAIRYTSVNKFAMLLDDLSYVLYMGDEKPLVSGYNVYCDGKRVSDGPVAATSYSLASAQSGRYSVRVVYNLGESMSSNVVDFVPTSVGSVVSGGVSVVVRDGAVCIQGAQGKSVLVTTAGGSLVCRMASAAASETVSLPQGMYVVVADGETHRVVVR